MRKPLLIFLGLFAFFMAASIVTAVIYFSNCDCNPLKDQLYQQAAKLFPVDTPLSKIEPWAKAQPILEKGTTRGLVKGVGDLHEEEATKAGLDTSKLFCVIRLDYEEERCLDKYRVHLFFFFDQNDKLVKVWTSEWIVSL